MTRYYDPEIGRFISADALAYLAPETINGLNLYAYCYNNPVMGYDPDGTWSWSAFGCGLAIIAAAVVAVAVTAATLGAGSVAGGIIIAGTIGVAGDLFSQTVIEGKSFSEVNYAQTAINGVASALSAIPGVGYISSIAISSVASFASALVGGADMAEAGIEAIESAGITAIGGGIARAIGLSKISKIGKGNYANKKIFLNHTGNKNLSSFTPAINKMQTLICYIHSQIGMRGLSKLANDTAGTTVNTIINVISSIIP